MQRLTHQDPQQDVLECLALKARDKDQVARTIALEALAEGPSAVFQSVLSTEKLLAIFDANLLSINGITDAKDSGACLRAAAHDCRTVSMTLELLSRFILGSTDAEDTRESMLEDSKPQRPADVVQVLDRLDAMDFVSMTDQRYAAYHTAICHVLADHAIIDDLLQQAVDLGQEV